MTAPLVERLDEARLKAIVEDDYWPKNERGFGLWKDDELVTRREVVNMAANLLDLATYIRELEARVAEVESFAEHWHREIEVIATIIGAPTPEEGTTPEAVRGLQDRFAEEVGIVNRIWAMFGSPSYEELAGRSIYDLIAEERAAAESRIAALTEGLRGFLRAEYESASHGLLDCIDNHGAHYQSQFLADQIKRAEELVAEPRARKLIAEEM